MNDPTFRHQRIASRLHATPFKHTRYEQAGVAELWLVDTPAEVVLVPRRASPEAARFDVRARSFATRSSPAPCSTAFARRVDDLFA